MRKTLYLFSFVLIFQCLQAQQVVLFSEDFENYAGSFTLNDSGPASNFGYNQWVVNDSFNGRPEYPNTPNEDSVLLGSIFDAPYSHYLHIYDTSAVAGGIANANWNPTSASDRFCYTSSSFCTAGFSTVSFSFFWICEGDSNTYGQVYYRANGGPWVQTGQPKYFGQGDWIYETINDTGFANVQNLQFGFRWVNATGGSSNVSFGLDDIIAVGNYDSINHPVKIHVSVLDTLLCQGNQATVSMQLSEPLCGGAYQIQMSNAAGSFAAPYNLGTIEATYSFDSITFLTNGTPGGLEGSCFRIRVVRESLPFITSDTSACFTLIACPNLIFNVSSAVMTDPDTPCVLSELDISFNSTGVFGPVNSYYAEISNAIGSFSDSTILGKLAVRDSFPSFSQQGDIAGLLPASLAPGCGYYIRVFSTSPYSVSNTIGPFCIKHCDELTNGDTDIHLCIGSNSYPQCDTLHIQPHYWDNNETYSPCNQWKMELLDMQFFSVADSVLGSFVADTGGYFSFCMPSSADSLPLAPGEYYMRIVSTCGSEASNQKGTIIRITIGAPSPTPPTISENDSVFCSTGLIGLTLNPFLSPPSNYLWVSSLLNNGNPFYWPYNPLEIQLNTLVIPGTYGFYAQEVNYGCVGPLSQVATATILGNPSKNIEGSAKICLGDTAAFSVTLQPATFYQWSATEGVEVVQNSSNVALMRFDSLGTFTISNKSISACGNDSGGLVVLVVPPFSLSAGPDTTVCTGQPVELTALPGNYNAQFIVQDTGLRGSKTGGMFSLVAQGDVVIDSFGVKYGGGSGYINESVYGKNGFYHGYETDPASWTLLDSIGHTYVTNGRLTVIPANLHQTIAAGDTFSFYLATSTSSGIFKYYGLGRGISTGTVYNSDSVISLLQGAVNTSLFGPYTAPDVLDLEVFYSTKDGLKYKWSTGDTTQQVLTTPSQSSNYVVQVFNNTGCSRQDTVTVTLENCLSIENVNGPTTKFNILPNPTSGLLSIEGIYKARSVSVYNTDGQKLMEDFNFDRIIDISGFAGGVYYISVVTDDNVYTKKIILAK